MTGKNTIDSTEVTCCRSLKEEGKGKLLFEFIEEQGVLEALKEGGTSSYKEKVGYNSPQKEWLLHFKEFTVL